MHLIFLTTCLLLFYISVGLDGKKLRVDVEEVVSDKKRTKLAEKVISKNITANLRPSLDDGAFKPTKKKVGDADNNALIVVGPPGSGKTTLTKRLITDLGGPHRVHMLLRHTSRAPRPHEVNGSDYLYVTRQDIEQGSARGDFVAVSELADNLYAIGRKALKNCLKASKKGQLCIADMMANSQVLDVLRKYPEMKGVFLFIRAPTINVLEKRLRARKTETDDAIARRVLQAKVEMTFCDNIHKRHLIDYCLVNGHLDHTYWHFKDIVRVEFPWMLLTHDAADDVDPDEENSLPLVIYDTPSGSANARAAEEAELLAHT